VTIKPALPLDRVDGMKYLDSMISKGEMPEEGGCSGDIYVHEYAEVL